jgi:hypothetical protein
VGLVESGQHVGFYYRINIGREGQQTFYEVAVDFEVGA